MDSLRSRLNYEPQVLGFGTSGRRGKVVDLTQLEVYLNALGARRIPDPTTAGDFCRRFEPHHIRVLLDVYHDTRIKVWARQSSEFFDEARIDMDGTLVPTGGECKEGMDISYNGVWGYHPLVV